MLSKVKIKNILMEKYGLEKYYAKHVAEDFMACIETLKDDFPNSTSMEFVHYFPMLHSGWEGDNHCYIVDVDGIPVLLHTNHGSLYYSSYEQARKMLEDKIKEYETAAKLTKDALALLR